MFVQVIQQHQKVGYLSKNTKARFSQFKYSDQYLWGRIYDVNARATHRGRWVCIRYDNKNVKMDDEQYIIFVGDFKVTKYAPIRKTLYQYGTITASISKNLGFNFYRFELNKKK